MTLQHANIQTRLGLCAAALAGTAAAVPNAQADIITFNTPIAIPATFSGVYVNLGTGAIGGSAGAVPGWDFNPYLVTSTTALGFYWSPDLVGGLRGAGVATTAGGTSYADLALGTVVSSASPFTSAIQGTNPNYLNTGTHFLGFRFVNETTGAMNFGYMTITTGSGNGFPATIQSWSYDNTGAAITVVPEPQMTALLTIGAIVLGALGVRKWRRQATA
ncbi:MAG: PEP-CTERM sorting domain-containing protein [Chthoniobacterales bacterium]|nr:PEP-CTERM sorting domain-containing protein [Chthoniobacterales bacterium]